MSARSARHSLALIGLTVLLAGPMSGIAGPLRPGLQPVGARPAGAQGDSAVTVAVKQTSVTAMVGEPVVLDCAITNTSGSTVAIAMGACTRDVASAALIDAATRSSVARSPAVRRGGLLSVMEPVSQLATGESRAWKIVASQLLAPPRPGEYLLDITITLQVYADPFAKASKPPRRWVVKSTITLPFKATAPDDAKLQAIGGSLRDEIASGPPTSKSLLAIDSLFSMPARWALPAWRSLAANTRLDTVRFGRIVDDIAYLEPAVAADLLSAMAANQIPWAAGQAHNWLRDLYLLTTGDAKACYAAKLMAIDGKLPKE